MKAGKTGESGVALLSVMALIATMSVAAIIALDALSRVVVLSKSGSGRSQAAWLMASAESIAVSALGEIIAKTDGKLNDAAAKTSAPITIFLPEGSIQVVISEASNCFNLNSIVAKSEGGGYVADDEAASRLKALVQEIDPTGLDAHALVDTLADWIDKDATPSARGLEDGYYISLTPPYRTAGTLLSSTADLRAVAGFDSDVRNVLAPMVCVRPTTEDHSLNVNTISQEEAPLLTALLSPALDAEAARRLIGGRPPGGWTDVEAFLSEEPIMNISPLQRRDQVLSVASEYFDISGQVTMRGEVFPFELLLHAEGEGNVSVVSRRFGVD